MKKMAIWALGAAMLCGLVWADGPRALAPERAARIDALLQRYTDEGRIPGAVALVLRDGRPVYEKAFGWSDKEARRKMTTDTLFRIASQTKAFTSAAVLELVEEGKIAINEPVGDFLATFKTTSVAMPDGAAAPAKRTITIHDLLTHRSEEHTSELQSHSFISYAVFCLKKKNN